MASIEKTCQLNELTQGKRGVIVPYIMLMLEKALERKAAGHFLSTSTTTSLFFYSAETWMPERRAFQTHSNAI